MRHDKTSAMLGGKNNCTVPVGITDSRENHCLKFPVNALSQFSRNALSQFSRNALSQFILQEMDWLTRTNSFDEAR
jgi:hypothetical protein